MSCDIHILYQKQTKDGWQEVKFERQYNDGPFTDRCYAVFAFLAGVRNYSGIRPISTPRGFPEDTPVDFKQECDDYGHTPSWLSLQELLNYNYNMEIEDLRVGKWVVANVFDGAHILEPGQGQKKPLGCYLGIGYMMDLLELYRAGVDRIIFCFDS